MMVSEIIGKPINSPQIVFPLIVSLEANFEYYAPPPSEAQIGIQKNEESCPKVTIFLDKERTRSSVCRENFV